MIPFQFFVVCLAFFGAFIGGLDNYDNIQSYPEDFNDYENLSLFEEGNIYSDEIGNSQQFDTKYFSFE